MLENSLETPLIIIIKSTSEWFAHFCHSIRLLWIQFNWPHFSIFGMLADLNSGTVFAFLAMSAPFLGVSLYNFERVRMHPFRTLNPIFCCIFIKFEKLSFSVRRRHGIGRCRNHYFCFSCTVLWFDLAISAMPSWNSCHRAHTIHWFHRLQCKMAQLSARTTKVYHFDYCSISIEHQFQWIQFAKLLAGGFC